MIATSLKFGTSGLRGLARELDGDPAYLYTLAFLQTLLARAAIAPGSQVAFARDLRPSSPSITAYAMGAAADLGLTPLDCGEIPTPALCHFAMNRGLPAVMITGSHIPDDRNGLKFYRPDGEIDKRDEADIDATLRARENAVTVRKGEAVAAPEAREDYIARYVAFLAPGALEGCRVGVYQHSSVARDVLVETLSRLGAEVEPLGWSDTFIPVDTEALRPEDIALLETWGRSGRFDAIVSTDGDADRPLIADETGRFVRGDLVGAITSAWIGADRVVVPVTANSALESRFPDIVRTKVGSPYVIAGMASAGAGGCIVGFEANGGFLLGSDVERSGRTLGALPTRDALLPILACLASTIEQAAPLSAIAARFGFRHAASDRLTDVDPSASVAFLDSLDGRDALEGIGVVAEADRIDGLRMILDGGAVVHFRPSGNAPELRCYVEANSPERAAGLLQHSLSYASEMIEVNKTL